MKDIKKLSPQQRLLLEQRLQERRKSARPPVTIPPRQDSTLPPLSFAQERLWFLHQLYPESAFYNIPAALWLAGAVDLCALTRSFTSVVARHETLRTSFRPENGQPVQIIAPATAFQIAYIDLRAHPGSVQKATVTELIKEEARLPFDLSVGPLCRVRFVLIEDGVVILLTLHHSISDGWSTGILIEEVEQFYEAYTKGEQPSLPALPIQYADYAVWQRQWLDRERVKPFLAYWTDQLAHLPALRLPLDYTRPARPANRGDICTFHCSEALSTAIHQFCRREKVTSFIMLLAAFQVLLSRYSQQDDIAVGIPISNRPFQELERLIGFFTNTLVLRVNLAGNPTFREVLARVREVAVNAYTYQDLPFEKLVEALQPQRDIRSTPLFQVMFNLQKSKREQVNLRGLKAEFILPLKATSIFDLTINFEEDDTSFGGFFEYNSELFTSASIERMIENFQTLLEALVADIDQPIMRIPIIAPESRRLLERWGNPPGFAVPEACIHELFEAQVEQIPDSIAVVAEQHALTYYELNWRANQLARYLCQRGIGPEVAVGLCMERSVEMMLVLLSILKAGGYYVALDPDQPPARQRLMLANARVHIVLTQESLLSRVRQSFEQTVLCLEQIWPDLQRQEGQNLVRRVSPAHLAYIAYTSGSTGMPKGIMAEHGAVVDFCHTLEQTIYARYCGKLRRVGLNAPLNFDGSIHQIQCLFSGQTLCIVPAHVRVDGQAFLAYLSRMQLDAFDATPTQLRLLLAAGFLAPHTTAPQVVLSSGEAIDDALWQTLASAPATVFYNVYGPTECTVDTTVCKVEASHTPSIGQPLPGRQVYILDKALAPVPIGVPGELFIGGPGLSRGYIGQPDETSAAFIPHPFSTRPGTRLYRTGDAARFLANGTIEFLGRLDWQMKFHSFRIEPGEIEAALNQYPGVRQSIVMLREDLPGEQQIVAYVTAEPDLVLNAIELRTALKQFLPSYMLPARIVTLDSFPLSPNGKIDRKALPAPEVRWHEQSAFYVAPSSEIERQLTAIWCSVLNLEKVGIHDNFFDLGGHSLSLVQVHQQVQEAFQTRFSLVEMYAHPTVSSVATYLAHALRSGSESEDQAVSETDEHQTHAQVESRRTHGVSLREALLHQKRLRGQKNKDRLAGFDTSKE